MRRYTGLILVISILSGCSNLLSQKVAELAPSQKTNDKGEIITLPAQLRTVTNKLEAGSYISCAEPGPDVALSDTFKLITGIISDSSSTINSGEGVSASAANKMSFNNDLQTSTAALELAGRTQTVLLAREFLFRICESASNGWINKQKVESAHSEILAQITKLIETDKKKAETTANIAGAVAAGNLDPKLLGISSAAVNTAIFDSCTNDFEGCITKAGADAKAKALCKSNLNKCLN